MSVSTTSTLMLLVAEGPPPQVRDDLFPFREPAAAAVAAKAAAAWLRVPLLLRW